MHPYTRETLQAEVQALAQHGAWSYDIPLPFGVWTRGNEGVPHVRLQRIVQAATDLCGGSLAGRRVLDLGCLEGLFAIEFAKHGAEAVGVEIREASLAKAELCKRALGLDRLTFAQDDVRKISLEKYGKFDIIICSGILYHLPATDVFELMSTMYQMVGRLLVLDTHIALEPQQVVEHRGIQYSGVTFREHADGTSQQERARSAWASWDNTTSFWPTRPSLVNLMLDSGFSSVFECFMSPPTESDPSNRGGDRCTFGALKGETARIEMNPAVNQGKRRWREGALSYAAPIRLAELVRLVEKRGSRAIRKLLPSRKST